MKKEMEMKHPTCHVMLIFKQGFRRLQLLTILIKLKYLTYAISQAIIRVFLFLLSEGKQKSAYLQATA